MNRAQKEGLVEEFMPDVEGLLDEVLQEYKDAGHYVDGLPREDLIQEGYVGLMEGINSISDDPDEWMGGPLDDQIHEAIKDGIRRALDEQDELKKKDDRLIVQVEMLNAAIDKLTKDLGVKPNIDELANELGVTQDKVLEILKLTGEDLPEDEPVKPLDEETLEAPAKEPVPHIGHHRVI